MDDHLGYSKSERSDSNDYCNGYKLRNPSNVSVGANDAQVSPLHL